MGVILLERFNVRSSIIQDLLYHHEDSVTEVRYKNGKNRKYKGLTIDEVQQIAEAQSVGKTLMKRLKSCEKLNDKKSNSFLKRIFG